MTATLRLDRCPSCGSVFRGHLCAGPYATPTCACGHPEGSHHLTAGRRVTYCTVWDPGQCPCGRFQEAKR